MRSFSTNIAGWTVLGPVTGTHHLSKKIDVIVGFT
jgi:hypothetical protein